MLRSTLFHALATATLAAAAAAAAVPTQGQSSVPPGPPPFAAAADGRVDTHHLTLRLSSVPAPAAPGARVTLVVDITPKPKMHVYAPEQKDMIPVSLRLAPSPLVRPSPLVLPPSERYFFAPLNETQRVYSKPFRLEQPITLAAARTLRAQGDTLTVAGRLRYQACDDAICYLPQEVPLAWTLEIAGP